MTIHDQHMKLIDAVNNAPDQRTHRDADIFLHGWRNGVEAGGRRVDLIAADLHQMEVRGINREMCCGVFLDWSPAAEPVTS